MNILPSNEVSFHIREKTRIPAEKYIMQNVCENLQVRAFLLIFVSTDRGRKS